ncbi:hypothetical protein [Paludibaculum fermentans]|uniref:hypothetical protein n=1 Tax=Paludibaculum fermentans TaxID=1473598 RepID=UPI003EBF7852
MNRRLFSLLSASVLIAAAALAQGHNGPGTPGTSQPGAPAPNLGLNMAAQKTIDGVITSVQLSYGVQYPSIVVNQTQIKVAPVWFLLENDFELASGDTVSILAAPSNNASDTYLYAIRITRGAAGITLRDSLGIPVWTSQAGGRAGLPQGPSICGACLDPASAQTATGVIDRVNAGVGIQQPTLVLKLADASLLTLKLGSERLILGSDFELNAGATLTVKYATSTCTGELVALQLTGANGETLILRD